MNKFSTWGQMPNPLVSIIIPCYNAATWVAEAIKSALNQTYTSLEVIVIDDGSTDNSLTIIKTFEDCIRWETGHNRGGSAARNRGFELSNGEYVLFLDADDLLAANTVEVQITNLMKHTRSVSACNWWRLQKQGELWVSLKLGTDEPSEDDYIAGWLCGWFLPCHAILWPRALLVELGGWDPEISSNDDGDLMLRALISGVKITRVNAGGAYYRYHGMNSQSVSSTISPAAVRSQFRVLQKAEANILSQNLLMKYSLYLGQAYFGVATRGFGVENHIARAALHRSQALAGNKAIRGSLLQHILCRLIGLERKQQLVALIKCYMKMLFVTRLG